MLIVELEYWMISRKWTRNGGQGERAPNAGECPNESLRNINQTEIQVRVKGERLVHCPCPLFPLVLGGYCAFCKLCHKVTQWWCGSPNFSSTLCRCTLFPPLSSLDVGCFPSMIEAEVLCSYLLNLYIFLSGRKIGPRVQIFWVPTSHHFGWAYFGTGRRKR
jgi:hypothetical protein